MSYINPDLKVPTIMLLTLLLVSERYYEVVNHYLLPAYIIIKHRRLTIVLSFINVS